MKRIFLLGSTGSIGQNTLEVVASHTDKFKVAVLVANKNIALLKEQIDRFKPDFAVIFDQDAYHRFNAEAGDYRSRIKCGNAGLSEVLQAGAADIFVNAFVGFAGLAPTIQAIRAGLTIALANKETLVVAGGLISGLAAQHRVALLPIDSEHSAIWQCLRGEEPNTLKRIILTASGGPFRSLEKSELERVTPQQALRHPNWKMGAKITIDSATLMNKGLEVIEAHWLYQVPAEKIEVVIHPQSIIHSMVEFSDHSIKAQMGVPDMKIPIQYALSYPQRLPMQNLKLDFTDHPTLTFEPPDLEKFPCLPLAYRALQAGKSYPAALNAANEVAVEAFLNGQIGFTGIARVIDAVLDEHNAMDIATLEECVAADAQARARAYQIIKRKQNK